MGHRPFRVPVKLRVGNSGTYVAGSAWEALELLERDWPAERDSAYLRACAACRDAVDGFRAPEWARRALENAARAAGLLADRHRS
ncbi:DUF982 domain-containing protein [Chelatococcus composti]|uniref:DUF982 domain-containing protein n=1 Tax=Chelatococcus composti TaxID=1743235 RepID=A0A841K8M9_9HYPH|nr:DUF982 domain-containing protein [Chelatococcus composti]MBB6168811.1 hypothetical protein [Chelatococcus composti]MBS7737418.1 DUF982 domain-containing protein [Chelatococcus composti]GGG43105.1 hypothetical protein GCM10008026_24950 [Chelatococcus composti]